jgi:hypothetical protein
MTMKSLTLSCALALSMSAGLAFGQSLNIDINRTTGTGSGVSASSYGAASGQTGTWNSVVPSIAGATTLLDLVGANSGVTITRTGNSSSSASSASTGAASTDYSRLVYDYSDLFGPSDTVTYTLNGMDQGLYRMFVYACIPGAAGFYTDGFGSTVYHGSTVSVNVGGASVGSSTTSGPVVGNVFQRGVTHSVFNMPVGAGAPAVTVTAFPSDGSYFAAKAAVNGMQLVKITGNRLYVDWTNLSSSAQVGTSWATAISSLSEALELARVSNGQITEIWVADGDYKPTPINSRSSTFTIPSGVKIYGGFKGNETSISQRDLASFHSVLSGQGPNDLVNGDNIYHIVTMKDCNSSTLLDGFSLIAGFADLNATSGTINHRTGGGMVIDGGNPLIRNCDFQNNYASLEGGAVMIQGVASPDFVSCIFEDGIAGSYGGAIRNTSTSSSTIYLMNCKLLDNRAGLNGGAVNNTGAPIQATNSLFIANSALSGAGGAIYSFAATTNLTNCTVGQNDAARLGGLGAAFGGHSTIGNSIFFGNTDTDTSTTTQSANVGAESSGTITINYSRVFGLDGSLGGSGNIGTAVTFVDTVGADGVVGTLDDNWSLQPDSAGVDAGSNSLLPTDTFDLNGNLLTFLETLPLDLNLSPRRVDVVTRLDTGFGASPVVDMGAFETRFCAADFNKDGFLDFTDFDDFVAAFENGLATSDFNGDGFLDFTDFDDVVAAFEAGC